jgi:Flp pilus assembly pilin Flp
MKFRWSARRLKAGASAALRRFRGLVRDDSGQDIVEYALLGALIGIAALLVWQQLAALVGVTYDQTTGAAGTVQDLSACTPDPGGGGC